MTYYYPDGGGAWTLFTLVILLLPFFLILAVACYVVGAFFTMRLFEKAGVEGKWRAWVPVYNMMVFAKLGDFSPWWALGVLAAGSILGQIPVIGWILSLASIVVAVMYSYRVGLKVGKDWPYLFLWLIPIAGPFIWLGLVAFTATPWNTSVAPAPWANSFLRDTTVWDGIPVQSTATAAPAQGYQPPAGGYSPPASPAATQPPAAPQPPSTTPPAPEPPAGPDAPRV